MKIMLLLIFAFFSNSTMAASLDDLYSSQSTQTIQPVSIEGKSVTKGSGPSICGSLGYTRLVRIELVPCNQGEKLAQISAMASTAAHVSHFYSCSLYDDRFSEKIKLIECAR